jgi:hypothetical protein
LGGCRLLNGFNGLTGKFAPFQFKSINQLRLIRKTALTAMADHEKFNSNCAKFSADREGKEAMR